MKAFRIQLRDRAAVIVEADSFSDRQVLNALGAVAGEVREFRKDGAVVATFNPADLVGCAEIDVPAFDDAVGRPSLSAEEADAREKAAAKAGAKK